MSEDTQRSPTKLVYIINALDIGGAEIGMCRLLDGLDQTKYEVTVISLNGHSKELVEQIPSWVTVIDLNIQSGPTVSGLRRLWTETRSADVIVGSLFHSVIVARFAGIFNRGAIVATWHHSEQFKTKRRQYLFGKTNKLSDVIMGDSDIVAEMLQETYKFPDHFIKTVPIAGINLNEFDTFDHIEKEPVIVGSVGRIAEEKNFTTVIDVAERLPADEIKFEIAGEGPLLNQMRNEVRERKISNITFHGEVEEIPEFLSSVDIYFQPSLYEGLCITVLEAMAAGLPIIGSDVGGIGRNVEHGENGYLYDPNDIEGFTPAIETLASDPELRAQFGIRGRKVVEDGFTQEVLVKKFEKAVRL